LNICNERKKCCPPNILSSIPYAEGSHGEGPMIGSMINGTKKKKKLWASECIGFNVPFKTVVHFENDFYRLYGPTNSVKALTNKMVCCNIKTQSRESWLQKRYRKRK